MKSTERKSVSSSHVNGRYKPSSSGRREQPVRHALSVAIALVLYVSNLEHSVALLASRRTSEEADDEAPDHQRG